MARRARTGPAVRDRAPLPAPPAWFLPAYVVGAYAISWAWWVPMALTGTVTTRGTGWPTHLPGLLGPALSAIVVTAVALGRPGLADLGRRMADWRATRGAWLLVLLTSASLLLAPLVAWATGQPQPGADDYLAYSGASTGLGPLVLLYVWIVNGFGEEVGWRGTLVEHLVDRHGLRRTALITAAVWALWHLPMFWVVESFREFAALDVLGWLVGLTLGSVLLAWLYVRGNRSIFLVATWHAAYNLTTATEATAGATARVSSTLVMVIAVWVLVRNASSGEDG